MIVVVPYCTKDYKAAAEQYRWMSELDGRRDRSETVLLAAAPVNGVHNSEVVQAAKTAFGTVTLCRQQRPDERGWPASCTAMFAVAVSIMCGRGKPWLWLEPDCVPLRRGWLEEIESEYASASKPFMGAKYDKPFPHLNGVAVYPPDPRRFNPHILRWMTGAWDLNNPSATLAHAHVSALFQHNWSPNGHLNTSPPWTFPTAESVDAVVDPAAALFHRCKDGSLRDRIREMTAQGRRYRSASIPAAGSGGFRSLNYFVQLGRYGDLLNLLPICWRLSGEEKKSVVVVASEFADIFDGVSYAEPLVFQGDTDDLPGAVEFAKRDAEARSSALHHSVTLSVTQQYGRGCFPIMRTPSYARDAWELAGAGSWWGTPPPLVIDRRNTERERDLWTKCRDLIGDKERPLVLVCEGGRSSPWRRSWSVLERVIKGCSGRASVLDIGRVRAVRIYDLMALYERADLLVTIDTATLHLATASNIPVVQLRSDWPTVWQGTDSRANVAAVSSYSDATVGWLSRTVAEQLEKAVQSPRAKHTQCARNK